MIDLFKIKLSNALVQKQKISEVLDKNSLNSALKQYLYPVGIIPTNALESGTLYKISSYKENKEYLLDAFNFLFEDKYSNEEKNILILYYIIRAYGQFILRDDMLQELIPLLDIHSEKKEIEYILEELKYKYLQHLINSGSQNEIEKIQSLIDELEPIESSHNHFNINESPQ